MSSITSNFNSGASTGALVTLAREDYEALLASKADMNASLIKIEEQMKDYHRDTNDTLNKASSTIRSLRQYQITACLVGAASTICGIFVGAMVTYFYMRNHQ